MAIEPPPIVSIAGVFSDLRDPGIFWRLVNDVKTPVSEQVAQNAGWPVDFWKQQRRIRQVIARHSGQPYPPLP